MAKVILTREVTGLGSAGDVVTVKDGYARNYLLPRKFATLWTKGAEKQIEVMRRATRARELASVEDALAAQETLRAATVEVPAKAGSGGRLFGTVTTDDIAAAVKAGTGFDIDKRKIELAERIKTTGDYTVTVRLHESVVAPIAIRVVAAQ
ncbi:MAG: 50S ribosomal protein L9 [Bifidobacteriaceae bacterium]|jgi:large subunit ribosomal protein L9|nr:50S ribosomal protein L9 [Bifidobacteriaceae bacterium]